MADGSDAVADWPLLNALVNTAAGASWVSIHHGGGVGIGYSQHAGMVVVADGTPLGGREARAGPDDRPGDGRVAPRRRGVPPRRSGIARTHHSGADAPRALTGPSGGAAPRRGSVVCSWVWLALATVVAPKWHYFGEVRRRVDRNRPTIGPPWPGLSAPSCSPFSRWCPSPRTRRPRPCRSPRTGRTPG